MKDTMEYLVVYEALGADRKILSVHDTKEAAIEAAKARVNRSIRKWTGAKSWEGRDFLCYVGWEGGRPNAIYTNPCRWLTVRWQWKETIH
jgi:hypothetical protein